MRIALVHDFIYTWGGAEQVLKELHALFPEAPIYTAMADVNLVRAHLPGASVRTSSLQGSIWSKHSFTRLTQMPRSVEELDLSSFDVVLSSSGAFSHGVITGPQTHHICYCHSPMRYAWDWHAENARAWGGSGLIAPLYATWIHRLRTWDQVSAARVDTWVANSQTVAARIATYYRAPATVCYPPVAIDRYTPGDVARTKAVYTIGRLNKPKRLDILIHACAHAGLELRIAGTGPEETSLRALAAKLGGNVSFLGRVSDQENLTELRTCGVFGFAAEEDFGITPVEAQACGTPVVAYGVGGASETVLHGVTGLLVKSADPVVFADALSASLRTSWDAPAIRRNAERFSRERFASHINNIVSDAL